ncbi:MAG: SHOCT domain-containing protein [Acidimicrobiales bacterium]
MYPGPGGAEAARTPFAQPTRKEKACPKPDELVKLDALRQSGMLSQEEFVTEKAKLLS